MFDDREKKVKDHIAERDQELRQKEEDKIEVERRLNEYRLEQEKRKQEQLERSKNDQRILLQEIAAK